MTAHSEPIREATREEMNAAHVPLGYRDQCASLLIPLNECRRSTMFLPFKCEDLRHAYEKCQYDEYKKRVKVLKQKRRSNVD